MIDINIIQTNYIIHKEGYITNKKTNKILSASLNRKGGYYYVKIKYLDKWIGISIHRLVALAYIPNPNNLPCVNHKDENKDNNHVDNLEWCTCEYNNRYGTAPERKRSKARELGQMRAVVQLSLSGEKINGYESISDASRKTGVILQNIFQAANGGYNMHGEWRRVNTAGGYKWRWAKQSGD